MANESFTSILLKLKERGFFKDLIIKRGIEKEFFRVDKDGNISNSPHPISLGSALTNKFITTDFAEAQLELVTPVFDNINDLSDFLYSLHVFVAKNEFWRSIKKHALDTNKYHFWQQIHALFLFRVVVCSSSCMFHFVFASTATLHTRSFFPAILIYG